MEKLNEKKYCDCIINDLFDEMNGVLHYAKMYESAKEVGCGTECQVFKDMMKEEYSHAKMLKEFCHSRKIQIDDAKHKEAQELWEDVEQAMKTI